MFLVFLLARQVLLLERRRMEGKQCQYSRKSQGGA